MPTISAATKITLLDGQSVTISGNGTADFVKGFPGFDGSSVSFNSLSKEKTFGPVQSLGGTVLLSPITELFYDVFNENLKTSIFLDSNKKPTGIEGFTQRPKSNVLSMAMSGFLGVPVSVVTNPHSTMFQTVLEADFDTVRFGILNADIDAVAGMKVSIGVGTTLGASNGTLGLSGGVPIGGSFVAATQNGSASITASASASISTGATGVNIGGSDCSISWTDWMTAASLPRVDGSTGLPVLIGILTTPAGSKRSFIQMDDVTVGSNSLGWSEEGDALTAPYGRPYRVMIAPANDACANPAFMMVSNGACARSHTEYPPIVVEYTLSNGEGETLIVYSDSIAYGIGAAIQGCGWPKEFQNNVSTKKNPISICNLAVSGSNTKATYDRISATIGSFKRASVYLPSLSPNSLSAPIVAADITLQRKWFGLIRAKLNEPGLMMFTSTVAPTNFAVKAYGTSDATRISWNNRILESGFRVADFSATVSTEVKPNGQVEITTSDSFDGIHFKSTGYKKFAKEFELVYKKY